MISKKYLYISIAVFTLLPVFISCKKSEKEIETEYLSKAVEQAWVDSDYQWIVVLPGLGCHGCIQEGEAFMQEHIENKNIIFVLTKISSLKILQQKTGINNIAEHSNVYVDREDVFYIPTNNSIYPCIIRMKDGNVAGHEFQSPGNGDAFRKLEGFVLAQ
jgi:hypothetical protein